jgi:ribosomal subunit interface protein
MQISLVGQHLSIGASLKEYVEEKVKTTVTKYFDNAISANIHFTKQGYENLCNIVLNNGTGRHSIIRSDAKCDDIYSAFDMCIAKLEKQLRRYKSKLHDRHGRTKLSENFLSATKYVINPYDPSENEDMDSNPVIVAEKPASVMELSVKEAVMKMDLENLPALMFKNPKTQRINVVYYRKDGNISWVDSD